MSATHDVPALVGRNVQKAFRRENGEVAQALAGVTFSVGHGTLTALVGPDGAGKTTLLRLAAGLLSAKAGELEVLGIDVASDPQQIQSRISYMPQRFGLYEDLTVQENLDLYADLHGVTAEERRARYPQLMAMTALGPYTRRLAGRLSGGMKQKLGLACTLVRSPELLLLDEPTVGIDPMSRQELWRIILQLVHEEGQSVLMSTSYLDEAERCGHVVVLHQGKVLAQGPPAEVSAVAVGRTFLITPPVGQTARGLQARLLNQPGVVDAVPEGGQVRLVRSSEEFPLDGPLNGADAKPAPPRFEDGFMVLLHRAVPREVAIIRSPDVPPPPEPAQGVAEAVIQVNDLVRRFGTFTAVDHVSFEVHRGQIFGLLGPNGAGKTTTFRILCGLLPASEGTLRVAGVDLRHARASARQRIGYVAQKFSLYGQLTVSENLEFFASAYGLCGDAKRQRIDWAMLHFELAPLAGLPSGQLPGGYKQRLAMAAALLHEPDILFLDEPTSGADPLARREFWQRITDLAEHGVTVVVTTHFMEEAEYCDRVVILDAGQVLAQGTPADIRSRARAEPGKLATMEDAFIAIVQEARQLDREKEGGHIARPLPAVAPGEEVALKQPAPYVARGSLKGSPPRHRALAKLLRTWTLVRKEFRQIIRDPSSIAVGVVMPVLLIVLFGYALSLDVKNVPVAIVLERPTPEAQELAARFQHSPYFAARLFTSMKEAEDEMLARRVDGIVRIRSDYARNVGWSDAEVQILVHGTDANRARIIQGYTQGAVGQWTVRRLAEGQAVVAGPVGLRERMWFNEANDSHYFLVPGLVVLVMTLIGAMLTSLVVAREWERGTLEALFVTPVEAGEILLGKIIPYFVLGMFGLALCLLAARFLFDVPLRGSIAVLAGVSMLYLLVALGIGLVISTTTKSQFVAIQLTMLVTFLPAMMLSGFLFDLRNMPVVVRTITYVLPARYFVTLLQTIFLAGNVWSLIGANAAVLAGMAGVLMFLCYRATKKNLN
jgi:ABC-type multidrug transport system ATPase subunit/ABC-type transport system involved in multi-copper enzyme maturation permease subunit